MNWQYILYNVDSGVAHVVLNRPEKLNALGMGPGSNRVELAEALEQDEHFAALEKLLQTADIFIYSVRPEAMARMGLTPERFAELNPGMISVSLVGYGEGGPYTGRTAYEDLIQGLTAIPCLLTRTGSAQPQYVPVSFNDRAVRGLAAPPVVIKGEGASPQS